MKRQVVITVDYKVFDEVKAYVDKNGCTIRELDSAFVTELSGLQAKETDTQLLAVAWASAQST